MDKQACGCLNVPPSRSFFCLFSDDFVYPAKLEATGPGRVSWTLDGLLALRRASCRTPAARRALYCSPAARLLFLCGRFAPWRSRQGLPLTPRLRVSRHGNSCDCARAWSPDACACAPVRCLGSFTPYQCPTTVANHRLLSLLLHDGCQSSSSLRFLPSCSAVVWRPRPPVNARSFILPSFLSFVHFISSFSCDFAVCWDLFFQPALCAP